LGYASHGCIRKMKLYESLREPKGIVLFIIPGAGFQSVIFFHRGNPLPDRVYCLS
jgi:hypothetical protein